MQLVDGRFIFSASDLNDYLECKRLTEQNLLVAAGRIPKPNVEDEQAELVRRKGEEHEARYLAGLLSEHGPENVAQFEPHAEHSVAGFQEAADRTYEEMSGGRRVVSQATFFDGQFLGRADFLRRIDTPSERWPWSYEVLDTKLALNPKPYFVVQLCNYSEHLQRLQGSQPTYGYIILGDGTEVRFRLRDYFAYYRHLKENFVAFAGDPQRAAADVAERYPLKCGHCKICSWDEACTEKRKTDGHLSGVAWMRRDAIARFEAAGITTMEALARAEARPDGMADTTFQKLRRQAQLQVEGAQQNRRLYDLIDHRPPLGFAMLPQPAAGDVFFDIEGDPLYEPGRGLEYLFGCWMPDDSPEYRAFWGCDRSAEKAAFEAFVDFVVDRRRRYPAMHVYHYADYEKSALRRLAQQHCTREEEVDDLLRGEVLVDLFAVVRQSLMISQDGYGLKKVEAFYDLQRSTEVKKGDESIVMFERWLADPDDRSILTDIEAYNRDDCRSTYLLRTWLLTLRTEAMQRFGTPFVFRPVKDPKAPCHAEYADGCKKCDARRKEQRESTRRSDVERRLLQNVVPPYNEQQYQMMSPDRRSRFLMANLIAYHRREERPQWWAYFDRRENVDRLKEFDRDSIGELEFCGEVPPVKVKLSWIYTYRYPEQQHKVDAGDSPHDPLAPTAKSCGTIVAMDEKHRTLQLKSTAPLEDAKRIAHLIPAGPPPTNEQRQALMRIAEAYLDGTLEARLPATYGLLTGRHPAVDGIAYGRPIQPFKPDAAAISAIVQKLRHSHLFIQGPPGSGKTTIGATVIADLLQAGKRVGVASTGHKAIHNLLHKVEDEMHDRHAVFRGAHKHSKTNPTSEYRSRLPEPFVQSLDDNEGVAAAGNALVGGTSWLFCRQEVTGAFDYLFIDEAGQVSLADALAMSACAKNVVLLGDPSQLSQVSQGIHPLHAGDSVLQHLLGDRQTVAEDDGIFLDVSYRMHPDICAFVSDAVYEGRLQAAPGTAKHAIVLGDRRLAGLRYVPVPHEGNASRSEEEADYIAGEISRLRTGAVIDSRPSIDGYPRALGDDDVLVITPYNAQRREIERKLEAAGLGVRVGTVDKFQGREAAVVFYSMASSSGEDAPRDMTFLFEKNRFNVAVSRARALSVLVCSPTLLEASCRTPEQIALANLLCEFAHMADADQGVSETIHTGR